MPAGVIAGSKPRPGSAVTGLVLGLGMTGGSCPPLPSHCFHSVTISNDNCPASSYLPSAPVFILCFVPNEPISTCHSTTKGAIWVHGDHSWFRGAMSDWSTHALFLGPDSPHDMIVCSLVSGFDERRNMAINLPYQLVLESSDRKTTTTSPAPPTLLANSCSPST